MRSTVLAFTAAYLLKATLASPILPRDGPPIDLDARQVAYELDARQLDPVNLISWSPKILYPTAGVTWKAGQEAYVTWNGTLPSDITVNEVNNNGTLVLGYADPGQLNLHLDLDSPLGTNIPLYTGKTNYTFKVPCDIPTRNNYLVVLLGNSGNASPRFTIQAKTSSDAVSSSTSAPASASSQAASTVQTEAAVAAVAAVSASAQSAPAGGAATAIAAIQSSPSSSTSAASTVHFAAGTLVAAAAVACLML